MYQEKIAKVWEALKDVVDPEIPVVSLIDMGIIRNVDIIDEKVEVTITPTFSGCPALHTMKQDIFNRIEKLGYNNIIIKTILSPPWTTDWITEEGRIKLKSFGLAPPPIHNGLISLSFLDIIPCPYCDSNNTTMKNNWGPTPCRMIFFCNNCHQPFEQFKPL